mmetsp:Transcript_31219/g.42651  ORF Transcript_31219/g.42651 Transcript_31219/m.42651 type:complete len:201 (-) Transcript_31219:1078-1680(-)
MESMKSGKWTEEEVSLAMRLIYEFENGIITGMSPKMTLRAFLAQQLRCDPMRISKKFAGRCVGKRPYSSYKKNIAASKSSSAAVENKEENRSIFGGSSSSRHDNCDDQLIAELVNYEIGDEAYGNLSIENLNKSKKQRCDQISIENSYDSSSFCPRSSSSSSMSSFSSCSSQSSISDSTAITPEDWAIAAACFLDSQTIR